MSTANLAAQIAAVKLSIKDVERALKGSLTDELRSDMETQLAGLKAVVETLRNVQKMSEGLAGLLAVAQS